MPFGLTNAPTTFQSCMNHIFNKQLRKFLLVFFDDLLIYNRTWEEHLEHLDEILSIMEDQSLYAKESKCEFDMTNILYLGHVISALGVQVHREKIQAILDWPPPKNLTQLHGFFGICNYWTVCKGILIVGCTTHRSHEERGIQVDRGGPKDI
jgi:hypothetical protein